MIWKDKQNWTRMSLESLCGVDLLHFSAFVT